MARTLSLITQFISDFIYWFFILVWLFVFEIGKISLEVAFSVVALTSAFLFIKATLNQDDKWIPRVALIGSGFAVVLTLGQWEGSLSYFFMIGELGLVLWLSVFVPMTWKGLIFLPFYSIMVVLFLLLPSFSFLSKENMFFLYFIFFVINALVPLIFQKRQNEGYRIVNILMNLHQLILQLGIYFFFLHFGESLSDKNIIVKFSDYLLTLSCFIILLGFVLLRKKDWSFVVLSLSSLFFLFISIQHKYTLWPLILLWLITSIILRVTSDNSKSTNIYSWILHKMEIGSAGGFFSLFSILFLYEFKNHLPVYNILLWIVVVAFTGLITWFRDDDSCSIEISPITFNLFWRMFLHISLIMTVIFYKFFGN